MDERAFVARVEAANLDELAFLLARPTKEEERVLRLYLGGGRYKRMRNYAVRRSLSRGPGGSRGNIVLLPGAMGSELASVGRDGEIDPLWIMPLRIVFGRLDRLRLSADGRSDASAQYAVRATGILKRYYGEALLALAAENWNVRAFSYDWRKELDLAADELNAQISGWFDDDEPVHLVAHSMGGLVARTFIKNHQDRWQSMWDRPGNGARGGRLVMLGVPNHGSFGIPRMMVGVEGIVRLLDHADIFHSKAEILQILNSFAGLLQMLPSPLVPGFEAMEQLYDAATYRDLNVPTQHLKDARKHHEFLQDAVDLERMINIAGANQPTYAGISDFSRLTDNASYVLSNEGDGRIPYALSNLTRGTASVPCYYIDEGHADLLANDSVLLALGELLQTGETDDLMNVKPSARWNADDQTRAQRLLEEELAIDEKRMEEVVNRLRARSGAARVAAVENAPDLSRWDSGTRESPSLTPNGPLPAIISTDEGELADLLTRDVLARSNQTPRPTVTESQGPVHHIEIGLVVANIQDLPQDLKVDAIAVGHYVGVQPQAAELALDKAISFEDDSGSAGLITRFAERGLIRGELGQPFIIPDPRAPTERVIALAGMGLPGRFGAPELTVLARELCWVLGQLGKEHLATVLIGAGMGNLDEDVAISAWLRGIAAALETLSAPGITATDSTGSTAGGEAQSTQPSPLRRVTFVQRNPENAKRMLRALMAARDATEQEHGLSFSYVGESDEKLDELIVQSRQEALERLIEEAKLQAQRAKSEPGSVAVQPDDDASRDTEVATRVTVGLVGNVYRFGAITKDAAIPERDISLDPALVMSANDELAAESNPDLQLERGIFLQGLLMPPEVRNHLQTNDPVVMMLDSTTARIHWEMVAQPDPTLAVGGLQGSAVSGPGRGKKRGFDQDRFLGTSRGFTRQLRTTFAPPPEPPPPPRRTLRVLVIADPSEQMPLPGAEAEGLEVADLFEAYNRVVDRNLGDNQVIVDRLLGPREATRTTALRYLMLRTYDVLHFAGHCTYNREQPEMSGWIFSNGECLSAHELNRIDRIPKFVFSNACESGVTPDRSELRSDGLAPSFAEAFFGRGVANFVCTAWPVDDSAARRFAKTLYLSLLGLKDDNGHVRWDGRPLPMHVAMQRARCALAERPSGARTWGAYQHYGNPAFRFFSIKGIDRVARNRMTEATDADNGSARRSTATADDVSTNGSDGESTRRPGKPTGSSSAENSRPVPVSGSPEPD